MRARARAVGLAVLAPLPPPPMRDGTPTPSVARARAGRVSEELTFNSITTGAADDLKKVSKSLLIDKVSVHRWSHWF